MPVYEYECKACDKIFEVQQKMSDDPISHCPQCGEKVTKIMSMNSFQLKGGGWYADGYASTKGGGASTSASSCSSSSGCSGCPAASSS